MPTLSDSTRDYANQDRGSAPRTYSGDLTDSKELRLALVLYGGVSLAIYMHGVTKELHKLVRASRLLDEFFKQARAPVTDLDARKWCKDHHSAHFPKSEWDTEEVYIEALLSLSEGARRLSVVIDIIGGASAGGVNGVCLANALAHNRSQDGIRNLWLEQGAFTKLANPSGVLSRTDGSLASVGALVLSGVHLAFHHTSAFLDGKNYSKQLFQVFQEMNKEDSFERATKRLVKGSLDLYTTTTDLRGTGIEVAAGDTDTVHKDVTYRQALHFFLGARAEEEDDFLNPGPLAFAARTTSSFPGAFPAVSIESFEKDCAELGPTALEGVNFVYETDSSKTPFFIDGGVLDNHPFGLIIDAIATKYAETETIRELVYLQPHPGVDEPPPSKRPDGFRARLTKKMDVNDAPSWFETVHAALSTIPNFSSIAEPLRELDRINVAISALGPTIGRLLSNPPTSAVIGDIYLDVAKIAEGEMTTDAICRALRLPSKSRMALFISSLVQLGTARLPDPKDYFSYKERCAQYAIQDADRQLRAVTSLADRERYKAMKGSAWRLLRTIQKAIYVAAKKFDDGQFKKLLSDAMLANGTDVFLASQADAQTLASSPQMTAFKISVKDALLGYSLSTEEAGDKAASNIFETYQGVDIALLPVLALARLPGLRPIGVTRFSPVDASMLAPINAEGELRPKSSQELDGSVASNFGAFFRRSAREHDYLWGRLDGVEMIVKLLTKKVLVDDHAGQAALSPLIGNTMANHIRDGFRAVLKAEETKLLKVGEMLDKLKHTLDNTTPSGKIINGKKLYATLTSSPQAAPDDGPLGVMGPQTTRAVDEARKFVTTPRLLRGGGEILSTLAASKMSRTENDAEALENVKFFVTQDHVHRESHASTLLLLRIKCADGTFYSIAGLEIELAAQSVDGAEVSIAVPSDQRDSMEEFFEIRQPRQNTLTFASRSKLPATLPILLQVGVTWQAQLSVKAVLDLRLADLDLIEFIENPPTITAELDAHIQFVVDPSFLNPWPTMAEDIREELTEAVNAHRIPVHTDT